MRILLPPGDEAHSPLPLDYELESVTWFKKQQGKNGNFIVEKAGNTT